MAVPAWFDFDVYMANKLAQVQAANPAGNWTATSLALAFTNAGFAGEEGAYNHFVQFGAKEDVAPNSLFDAEEYYTAKAIQFNNTTLAELTAEKVDEVKQLIQKAGMNAWTHYNNFGSKEGVNPSNTFDESAYLTAKLTALQAADPTNWAGKTEADVSAAFKAAGFSALTHFWIFKGKSAAEVADGASFPVPADEQVTVITPSVPGSNFTLTTGTDTFIGTAGNDTVTGTSATLQAADTILDQTTTDNDVLNLTLTGAISVANGNKARIGNIENVNVDWNAFGTAEVDAENISGATITGTSSKVGFLGSFTVDNTAANNVVAGAGMTGTLQVNDATDTTVTGTAAKVINVDGSGTREDNVAAVVVAGENTTTIDVGATDGFDSVTVTGGAKTTSVTVNDSAAITVDAAAATTVTLNGTAETDDTATVTLGVDADLVLGAGAAADIETVTVNAADGITVDITGSDIKNLTVASAGAVTLVADASDLGGAATPRTITNEAGSLNIEVNHDAAADLSKVSADLITLTTTNASALTFATGANVLVAEDVVLNAGASFVGKSAATGTLNLTVLADQVDGSGTADIAVTALKTLNLTVELNADDADEVATLDGITSADDVTLTSANDVVVTALAVKNLDASASTGELTVTGATGASSIVGSQGNNDITLNSVAAAVSVLTSEGDDKVALGVAAATGDVTLVLGNGDNEVVAGTTGIKNADLSVVTGSGDDVIAVLATADAAPLTTEETNVVLELGDGANEVELTLAQAVSGGTEKNNATVVTGAGADTLTIAADTAAGDTISWTAGTGTDTLDISAADISAGSITLNGVDQIQFVAATSQVDGSLLNGKAFKLLGEGTNTDLNAAFYDDQLDVTLATAGTYDFSGMTFGTSLTDGAGGLDITTVGADKITATSGRDKITVANVAAAVTITAGKGPDSIILDDSTNGVAGTATVVFAAGDTGKTATTVDSITNFETGVDKLKIGIAGSATTFLEVDVNTAAGDQLGTAAAAAAAANTAFGGAADGKSVLFLFDGTGGVDGWLAIDRNVDGTVDELIQLVGLKATGNVVAADIIA